MKVNIAYLIGQVCGFLTAKETQKQLKSHNAEQRIGNLYRQTQQLLRDTHDLPAGSEKDRIVGNLYRQTNGLWDAYLRNIRDSRPFWHRWFG